MNTKKFSEVQISDKIKEGKLILTVVKTQYVGKVIEVTFENGDKTVGWPDRELKVVL